MSTSYETIYDRFYKKLTGDKKFFNYNNLSEIEIQELVADHSLALINSAIDYLYSFGSPDIDMYDKDDTLLQFNEDLTGKEISLLADISYFIYMQEDRNKLKILGLTFKSSEISVFSPANDRKEYENMLNNIRKEVIGKIMNYFSRDRITWQFKSIY